MLIQTRKTYDKMYAKLSKKEKIFVKETLAIFIESPFDKAIRNHALTGKYLGYRSIDVTGDLRILFREDSGGNYELVTLIKVGSHSQLYGR